MTDDHRATRRRPGPIYDDAMKVLADDDLAAILGVIGIHDRAERLNVELSASARKADLLARTSNGIVHVEFVKDHSPDLDLRMVDYRLRLRRRTRATPITQYVLVLGNAQVPNGYQDVDTGLLTCAWQTVRLDELSPRALLPHPTTAALASLARGTDQQRAAALADAAGVITNGTNPDRGSVLLAAAATLASIVLPRDTISSALKEAQMPVPVRDTPLGREIYEEARREGLEEGRREGMREGMREAALRMTKVMLEQRFGADSRTDQIADRLADLPDEQRFELITKANRIDDLHQPPASA